MSGKLGKRTVTVEEPLTTEDRQSDEQSQEIASFEDDVPGWASVRVYRYNNQSGKFALVGRFPREIFSEDWIGTEFGGGKWSVRLLDKDGHLLKTRSFETEGPRKDLSKEPGQVAQPTAPGNGAGTDAMKMVLEQNEKRIDDFKTFMETITTALANKTAAPAGPSILETIQALGALGLIGKSESFNPQQYAKDLQEAWRDGRTTGEESDRPRDTGFAGVVRDVVPILSEGMAMVRDAQRPARAALPPGPKPQPANPAPAGPVAPQAPAVDVTTLPPWLQGVYRYLGLLVGMANANMDPEATGDQILAKLDADAFDAVKLDAAAEDWEVKTFALLPPQLTQAHEGWTKAVLARLKAELTAPEEPAS